jgi:phosphatidylglycerol---prolipoprotein diacylglyceryl transferase
MVPVLLQLGPLTIYSFGAMMALGFLMAGYIVSLALARKGMDSEDAWSIVLWAAAGGIVGSRVLAILADWQTFLQHPIASIFSGSGFVWYGGLIGGFISVSLYVWHRGLRWLAVVDTVAPALAMGHAIGRIGCQVSGDGDWGKPTSLPWAVAYPRAIVGWHAWLRENGLPPTTRVHPAPAYETLSYCAIFCLLWWLREKKLPEGSLFWIYLVTSSIARFAVESIRVEPVLAVGMSQAQWIAIPLCAIGLVMLGLSRSRGSAPAVSA